MEYLIIESSGDGYDAAYKADVEEDTVHIRHEGSGWAEKVRGKAAGMLVDNGEGLYIKFDEGEAIELDYSQAVEMRILLQLNNSERQFKTKFDKYKLVEE